LESKEGSPYNWRLAIRLKRLEKVAYAVQQAKKVIPKMAGHITNSGDDCRKPGS